MHHSLSDRWSRVSLRNKITGVTVLMLTVGLLVSGLGTMLLLKPWVLGQDDKKLTAVAQSSLYPYLRDGVPTDDDSSEGGLLKLDTNEDVFIALYDSSGQLAAVNWSQRDRSTWPQVRQTLTIPEVNAYNADGLRIFDLSDTEGDNTFRAVVVPTATDPFHYAPALIAVSTAASQRLLAAYLTIYLGFGLGVVILGALLTRMLVTTTFAPLRQVERTAAEIAEGDFSQRLAGETPNTEVGRLNRSLNTMLNRIDGAFRDRARTIEQMRRFVGDASHELRTPLVSVRGYAELYRMGALQSPDDIAQAMERIEKEAIRMGVLVEDLLELARLDETKPLTLARVDLVPLAQDAALDAMAINRNRTVSVVTRRVGPARLFSGAEPAVARPTQPAPSRSVSGFVSRPRTGARAPTETTPSETSSTDGATALGGQDGGTAEVGGTGGQTSGSTSQPSFAGATLARLRRRPRKPVRSADAMPTADGTAGGTDTVAIEVGPDAPADIDAVVFAEENKIRQVITNLMGNAVRFTPDDGPIEIAVTTDAGAERVFLEIVDHGEGIAPAIREKIFQRFWRADTSRARETGGSGLGLAIVSSIVAAHNGTVDVVETPGGGATFRIALPLAGSASAPQQLSRSN